MQQRREPEATSVPQSHHLLNTGYTPPPPRRTWNSLENRKRRRSCIFIVSVCAGVSVYGGHMCVEVWGQTTFGFYVGSRHLNSGCQACPVRAVCQPQSSSPGPKGRFQFSFASSVSTTIPVFEKPPAGIQSPLYILYIAFMNPGLKIKP